MIEGLVRSIATFYFRTPQVPLTWIDLTVSFDLHLIGGRPNRIYPAPPHRYGSRARCTLADLAPWQSLWGHRFSLLYDRAIMSDRYFFCAHMVMSSSLYPIFPFTCRTSFSIRCDVHLNKELLSSALPSSSSARACPQVPLFVLFSRRTPGRRPVPSAPTPLSAPALPLRLY
jgi:hypothetical protein